MLLYSISFLLGICIIQQLAVLPEPVYFFALPACIIIEIRYRSFPSSRLIRYISIALAGALWATGFAHHYLDLRLAETLAGRNIVIEGRVIGIPKATKDVQHFVLEVDAFHLQDEQEHLLTVKDSTVPRRLSISWYYSDDVVGAGESWSFLVRLKPPHGFLNPGGFDYEAWLYQQGIHATGYVRESGLNRRLKPAAAFSLDALRQSLQGKINHHLIDSQYRGLVAALAVGDRSFIAQQQWDALIRTGTNHLMAISGLHIGLAAAFGYWITRRSLPAAVLKKISAQQVSICVGVVFAMAYALLAGLSIPTQRALIMLLCIAGAILLKRHSNPANVLSVALILVLLIDPVSVLSAGFWFSFLAVAAIFYLLRKKSTGLDAQDKASDNMIDPDRFYKGKILQWGGLQLVIAMSLFPLSLLMFQQTSLIAPIANFILVPFVSFLVVPPILLAIVFFAIYEPVALFALDVADYLLDFIWPWLHFLAELSFSYWVHHVSGLVVTVLAMMGIAIILSRLDTRLRISGALLLIPLFMVSNDQPLEGGFDVRLLDVGQGLSVILNTQNHVLVYDAGARFSDELDSGQAVVLPVLRAMGVSELDMLIISHGDNDHIGGAMSIMQAFPQTPIIGQDIESLVAESKTACIKGMQWEWDGVHFEFLHPDLAIDKKRNNRSCVLRVSGSGGSLLLTGDIEKKVEHQLLESGMDRLNTDVIVVPHHGSKTSSSTKWLEMVDPKMALFAVGYRNRYGLPSQDIVKRYRELSVGHNMQLLSTASSGAIHLKFDADDGVVLVEQYRKNQSKYWNHQIPEFY